MNNSCRLINGIYCLILRKTAGSNQIGDDLSWVDWRSNSDRLFTAAIYWGHRPWNWSSPWLWSACQYTNRQIIKHSMFWIWTQLHLHKTVSCLSEASFCLQLLLLIKSNFLWFGWLKMCVCADFASLLLFFDQFIRGCVWCLAKKTIAYASLVDVSNQKVSLNLISCCFFLLLHKRNRKVCLLY